MTGDDHTGRPDDSAPSGERFPGEEHALPASAVPPPAVRHPEPGAPAPPPASPASARLIRSRTDRIIGGVGGGLARYFGIDAVLVRIGIVVLAVVTAFVPVAAAYLVAWVVIPEDEAGDSPAVARGQSDATTRVILGALLISLGCLLFVNAVLPGWLRGDVIAALVVVAIGLAVIAQGARR